MSTREERVRGIVQQIGLAVARAYGMNGEALRQPLQPRDVEEATAALLAAAEVRPDEGEERPLPPIPERGARIAVLFRTPKEEGRHAFLDCILVEHGVTGLFWVPVDDETGVIFTPWADVQQYEGPKL